ncbi:LysR substrate-binding domain-containing protein [Imbroritus primus]
MNFEIMRRIPNFVLLRAFEAAARHESFTLAANELHLTQSAISHQIRELEEYFGRKLFIRRNRRVEPTAEGRRLRDHLSRAFDRIEAACNEVAEAQAAQVLTVFSSHSFAVKWLSPRLPEFMQAYPDITIRVRSGSALIDLTQMEDIDIAITYGAAAERPGLVVRSLGAEQIVPLVSPRLLDAASSLPEQMQRLPLIDSQLSPVTWQDWFAANGMVCPARPRTSFDRGALAISAAVDGVGVVLESVRLAEREMARGELVPVGASVFQTLARETHFLSYRKNQQHLAKVRLFIEWLIRQLGAA